MKQWDFSSEQDGVPMDRGAWCATVQRVTKSQTRISNYHTHTCRKNHLEGSEGTIQSVHTGLGIIPVLKGHGGKPS